MSDGHDTVSTPTPSLPIALRPEEIQMKKWAEDQIQSAHARASTSAGIMATLSLAAIPLFPGFLHYAFGDKWLPSSKGETITLLFGLFAFLCAAFLYRQAQSPIAAKIDLGKLADPIDGTPIDKKAPSVQTLFQETLKKGNRWSIAGFIVLVVALVLVASSMIMSLPDAGVENHKSSAFALVQDTQGILRCGELAYDKDQELIFVGTWSPTEENGVKQLWMVKECPGTSE